MKISSSGLWLSSNIGYSKFYCEFMGLKWLREGYTCFLVRDLGPGFCCTNDQDCCSLEKSEFSHRKQIHGVCQPLMTLNQFPLAVTMILLYSHILKQAS